VFTYDGAIVNIFHASKGQGLPSHIHAYSHASFCTSGSCVVRVKNLDAEAKEYLMNKMTQPLNLLGQKYHEIEALEDNTVFINIFAARTDQK